MTNKPSGSPIITYKPGQVTEILHLSPSTISRYARQYPRFLSPSAARPGRKRVYTPEDLHVLETIHDYTTHRKSQSEIENLLTIITPEKPTPPPDLDVRLAPYIADQFQQFSAQFAQQSDQIAQLLEEVKALRAELQEQHKQSFWDRFRRK